jgi:hypothetical protein
MARPRIPTALLELRGAFERNPNRRRARQGEPLVTAPLPDAPSHLSDEATPAWRQMKQRGYWLRRADQFLVEIAATLVARFKAGELTHGHVSVMIAGQTWLLSQRARRAELADTYDLA